MPARLAAFSSESTAGRRDRPEVIDPVSFDIGHDLGLDGAEHVVPLHLPQPRQSQRAPAGHEHR